MAHTSPLTRDVFSDVSEPSPQTKLANKSKAHVRAGFSRRCAGHGGYQKYCRQGHISDLHNPSAKQEPIQHVLPPIAPEER